MANESNIRSGFLSRGNSDVLGQFTITGGGASVPMLITGATNTILELRDQSSGDVLSVFKTDGTELFKVSTTGITVGGNYTLPLTDGTANQVLQTNGSGAVTFNTLNTSVRSLDGVATEALTLGDPVYIDSETSGTPNFSKAKQTLSPYKVPVGVAASTVSASGAVTVITFGIAENLDTSSYTAGDVLYVGSAGGLSTTVSVSSSGSTKVGTVVSSDVSAGTVLVDCGTFNENEIDLQFVTDRGFTTDQQIEADFVRANTSSTSGTRTTGFYSNKDRNAAPSDGDEGAAIMFGMSTTSAGFTPFTHAAITPYHITAGTTSTAVSGLKFSTYNGASFEDAGLRVHEKTITVGDTDTFTFPVGDGTNGQTLLTDGAGQLSWGSAGAESTGDLGDVTLAGLSEGDILLYDGVSTWQNAGMSAMSNAYTGLTNHSDVTLSSVATGNSLVYNGSAWANSTLDFDDVVQAGALTTAGIFVDNITTTGTGNNTFTGALNCNKGLNVYDTDLTDRLLVRSGDATAADFEAIEIYRLSNSPATNDIIGSILWTGEDDASNKSTYGGIKTTIKDVSALGAEGTLTLQYGSTGTPIDAIDINADGVTVKNYTLPYTAGTSGQVLKYPSSGSTLEWGDAGGGSTPVAYLNKSYRTFASTSEDLYYWFPGDDDYGVDDFIAENLSSLPSVVLGKINYGHVIPSGTRDLDITFVMSITDGSGNNVSAYNSQSPDIYFYKVDQTNGWQQIGTTQSLTMDATNTALPKELTYSISSQSFSVGEKLAVVLKGTQNVTSNTFIMWGYNIVVT
jgi:hypothetical protein